MDTVRQSLLQFNSIGLSELDKVQLLDRVDTKYVFHISQLEKILSACASCYNILSVDGMTYGHYETHYFDTSAYSLYHCHHNGRNNRYKIRVRTYLDSHKSFFEIKCKSNKGRTVKYRMPLPEDSHSITGEISRFLETKTDLKAESLRETAQINYNRIMLVSKNMNERLSIDFRMTYQINSQEHTFPDLVIAEVKQPKSGKSPFQQIMQQAHIRSLSISKYCFGIASFVPEVKKNAFKYKMMYINKLSNTYAI